MKYLQLLCCALVLSALAGCEGYGDPDNIVLTVPPPEEYEAITMERSEFEAAVQMMPAQAIVKAGKIYIKDGFLFLNDVNRGFHIYDYSDPASPVALGFLAIPGATDLAMRDNVLLINQATDLVTLLFDAGANNITVMHRNADVFPAMPSPNGSFEDVADNEIIVGWETI
ncbi:hypothetical protein [uncultured Flavobacterium sp.]|uniref:hypothetical protein n=1 Tax=uncultured Flavobacterium sp. TaxID=165435 RepID=UPI0025CD3B29|nr:hypothetical protein [uncultured Flavobacterium sp.]